MADSISTPGMGAMGIARALTGGKPPSMKGGGNKKKRSKLKKKVTTNKKKVARFIDIFELELKIRKWYHTNLIDILEDDIELWRWDRD